MYFKECHFFKDSISHVLTIEGVSEFTGYKSAIQNSGFKRLVFYEPDRFLFPIGEMPDCIDDLTGCVRHTSSPMKQFKRPTKISIIFLFRRL